VDLAIRTRAAFEVKHARTVIVAVHRAAIGVCAIGANAIFIEAALAIRFVATNARRRTLFDFEITIDARAIFGVGPERARSIIGALARTGRSRRAIRALACLGIVAHVVAKPIGLIAIADGGDVATSSETTGVRCG
jgi:hypothetical protein